MGAVRGARIDDGSNPSGQGVIRFGGAAMVLPAPGRSVSSSSSRFCSAVNTRRLPGSVAGHPLGWFRTPAIVVTIPITTKIASVSPKPFANPRSPRRPRVHTK